MQWPEPKDMGWGQAVGSVSLSRSPAEERISSLATEGTAAAASCRSRAHTASCPSAALPSNGHSQVFSTLQPSLQLAASHLFSKNSNSPEYQLLLCACHSQRRDRGCEDALNKFLEADAARCNSIGSLELVSLHSRRAIGSPQHRRAPHWGLGEVPRHQA